MNDLFRRKACALSASLFLLSGCTEGDAVPQQNITAKQESTGANELFIFTVSSGEYAAYRKDETFDRTVTPFLKQQFPGISIKHVSWDDGRRYEDLIAAGTYPDLVMDDSHLNLNRYIIDNDLHYDLRELMKKHNFDAGLLNKPSMDRMRNITREGAIYGLPFQITDFILYYNIDIFDKFGAAYPKNGITYDEAYELAKKLTRVDGDVTYRGYSQNPGHYMNYNQLSLHPLHPDKDRALLTTDGWIRLVDNLRRFYEIPANQFDTVENFHIGNIAMAVANTNRIVTFPEQNPNLNFDITAPPVFADLPESRYQPNAYSIYVTKQSAKKDLAFQVMAYLLSEEYQIEMAKEGIAGTVQTEAVQQAFGQNLPHMQGKNTSAVFYGDYAAASPARAEGLTYILVPTQYVFDPLIFDESKDTVTALRMTEEMSTKQVLTKQAARAR